MVLLYRPHIYPLLLLVLQVGDKINYIKVVSGVDKLVRPAA